MEVYGKFDFVEMLLVPALRQHFSKLLYTLHAFSVIISYYIFISQPTKADQTLKQVIVDKCNAFVLSRPYHRHSKMYIKIL